MNRFGRMIPALGAILTSAVSLWGAYTNYVTDTLTSYNSTTWHLSASWASPAFTAIGLSYSGNMSLVHKVISGNDYQVRATVRTVQSGGLYKLYLRATTPPPESNQALYANQGSYYLFMIGNVTVYPDRCEATMYFNRRTGGSDTTLEAQAISCRDGMDVRAVAKGNNFQVYVDGMLIINQFDSTIGVGQPGCWCSVYACRKLD